MTARKYKMKFKIYMQHRKCMSVAAFDLKTKMLNMTISKRSDTEQDLKHENSCFVKNQMILDFGYDVQQYVPCKKLISIQPRSNVWQNRF